MTYHETLDWMFNKLPMYQRIGGAAYKADLNNTIELMTHLGNPQNKFKTIHIAGTNGKGSVSHMLASIFQEAGFKTGLYTSPHLKDFRERIRLNGQMVPEQFVVDFIERNKSKFEQMQLSFFEMTVGMAFEYFATEKVDMAMIEVGMGGRLDSTNIITPELSVITNIGLDHVQFLGNTLPEIAKEKAGIIKKGIPVVIGETQHETKDVFTAKATEMGSPIRFADREFDCTRILIPPTDICHYDIWKNSELYIEKAELPLMGNYQKKNLATVACAIDTVRDKFGITEKDIRDGLSGVVRNTSLTGRWQILNRKPLVVADTGHNAHGIKEVVVQIAETPHNHLHFVLGMVNDKDIEKVLGLLPKNATYYFCKADIPRGLDAEKLHQQAKAHGLNGLTYNSVRDAYEAAVNNADANDLVFVGGSNFTVAEIV